MQAKRIFTYAFAIFSLLFLPSTLKAQKNISQGEESDTIQTFRGFAITYDLAGTVMRMVSDYGQYEAALHLNFRDRYFPVIELGLGDAKHATDVITGIEAKVSAPYGRIGCDLNVAKNKHDDYRIYVGARYGLTSFKTEAYGDITDPYWGGNVHYETNYTKNCLYHWAELGFAVDGKLWGPIRMGWSVRYKVKLSSSDIGANKLWYVPGYGKDGNKIGATFNVGVELWRKNKKLKN